MRNRILWLSLLASLLALPAAGERVTPTVKWFSVRVTVDGGDTNRFATDWELTEDEDDAVTLAQTTLSSGTERGVLFTVTDANDSSACAITLTGRNSLGVLQSEAIATDGAGVFSSTKFYATLTSVTTTCTGITEAADLLNLGEGAQLIKSDQGTYCVAWNFCRETSSTDDVIVGLNSAPAVTAGDNDSANYSNQLVLTAEQPCHDLSAFNPGPSQVSLLADVADTGSAVVVVEAICY